MALRTSSRSARFAAIADDSVHPVPCVCTVVTRGPLISKKSRSVPTTSIDSGPVEVSAFDQYDARAHARGSAPRPRSCRRRSDRHAGQDFRLGDVRRHDVGARQQFRLQIAATASSSSRRSPPFATITGSTTTCGRSRSAIAAATASTMAALASMPIFHGVGADVGGDGFDLRGHEIGRQRLPRGDAKRVLRGDRGDGRGADRRDARRTSSDRPACRRRRPSRCPQLSVLCAYSKIPTLMTVRVDQVGTPRSLTTLVRAPT